MQAVSLSDLSKIISNKKLLDSAVKSTSEKNMEDIQKNSDTSKEMNDSLKKSNSILSKLGDIIKQGFEENRKAFEASTEVALRNGLSRIEYGELVQEITKSTSTTEKLISSNKDLINSIKQLSNTFGLSNEGLSRLASANDIGSKILGQAYNTSAWSALLRSNGTDFDTTNSEIKSYITNAYNTQLQLQAKYGMSDYVAGGTYSTNQQILSKLESISTSSNKTSLTLSNEIQTLVGGIYEKVGADSTRLNEQLENLLKGKFDSINVGMWQALAQSGVNITSLLQGNVSDSDISALSQNYIGNFLNTYNDTNAWALVGALGYGEYDYYTRSQLQGTTVESLLEKSSSVEDLTYTQVEDIAMSTKSIKETLQNLLSNAIGSTSLGTMWNVYGNDLSGLSGLILGSLLGGSKGDKGGLSSLGLGRGKAGGALFGASLALMDAQRVEAGTYSDDAFANSLGGAFLGGGDLTDASSAMSWANGAMNVGKYASIGTTIGGAPGAAIGAALGLATTLIGYGIQQYNQGKEAMNDSRVNVQERVDAFGADVVIRNTEVTTSDLNDNILTIADILKEIANNTAGNSTVIG